MLKDAIQTCILLARRGTGNTEDKIRFEALQNGIKALGSGYLMSGHFRIEDAIASAARVAYLAAKILKEDYEPIYPFDKQDLKNTEIENPVWNFLNKLKRQPDQSAFFYWFKAIHLLDKQ